MLRMYLYFIKFKNNFGIFENMGIRKKEAVFGEKERLI